MDNNPTPEPNKELEDAANALNEAAVAAETPIEEPKSEEPKTEEPAGEMPAEPPIEPPVEPAPAPEPAPATTPVIEAPAPVAEPVVEAAPAAPAPEKKKGGKKGLIIGCVLGSLVFVGGGLGVAYAVTHTPENVALSAISNFLSTKEHSVKGKIEFAPTEKSGFSDFSNISISINNDTDKDAQTSTSATFSVTYQGQDYSINIDSVVIKDYTLYIKVSNLKDAINKAFDEAVKGTEYQLQADMYKDLINTVVGEIDGIYWKISVPELIDATTEIPSSQKATYKELYECVTDVAKKATADTSAGETYKSNAFITLKKYEGGRTFSGKGTAYNLSFDASKLASFANIIADKAEGYGFADCMKKVNYNYTYEKTTITEEDAKKAIESIPENLYVTIENSLFGSEITGFYYDISEEYYTGKVELTFSKPAKSVSAPADSKPITELYTNVKKAIEDYQETYYCRTYKEYYPQYYTIYCDPSTNKLRPEFQHSFEQSPTDFQIKS